MNGLAILPTSGEGFLRLSATKSGTTFKKHILTKGDLLYPDVVGGKVKIDDEFFAKLTANFNAKVCSHVQIPVAGANNEHTEDPDRNVGEVVGLTVEGDKMYAILDVRDEKAAPKFGKTYLGASAMLHLNYTDTRDGKKKGPTLLHVAVTNRPHIVDLEDYELLAATAPSKEKAVFLTAARKEPSAMDLDSLIAALRDEHGIDVPALQLSAAESEGAVKLSNTLRDALVNNGIVQLSAGQEVGAEDIIGAVAELASSKIELSNRLDALELSSKEDAAKAHVDELVRTGYIAPVKRDSMLKLRLSNTELFDELIPEKPLVKLSGQERGFDLPGETREEANEAEIARLTGMAQDLGIVIA
jgi:hypothetical protein